MVSGKGIPYVGNLKTVFSEKVLTVRTFSTCCGNRESVQALIYGGFR